MNNKNEKHFNQQQCDYRETSFIHIQEYTWFEGFIHGFFGIFIQTYLQKIKSSLYVPRLVRSIQFKGGAVPT